MFQGLWQGAIMVALILVPLTIIVIILSIWKWNLKRQKRRSPLTTDLTRLPAHGLRSQLDDVAFDLPLYMSMAMLVPVLFLTLHFSDLWRNQRESFWSGSWAIYLIAALACIFWYAYKLVKTAGRRRILLQAIEAEFATAQELEILKASGCKIFHDIQAAKFNIDHVLVGPGGVFAIETKSRLKPDSNNKGDCRVKFDGNVLKFPEWVEKKPLEQARAQARWLQDRLSRSTGESVKVKPVLALPGWFVERTGTSDVAVINPRNNSWMSRKNSDAGYDEAQIQRIAFQLEQLSKIEH